jgi:hypothetical protein
MFEVMQLAGLIAHLYRYIEFDKVAGADSAKARHSQVTALLWLSKNERLARSESI